MMRRRYDDDRAPVRMRRHGTARGTSGEALRDAKLHWVWSKGARPVTVTSNKACS